MAERRREKRIKEKNDILITTLENGKTSSKEKILMSHSNDISVLGARIQVNYFLPVNSLFKIEFNLKNWLSKITALAKVRWIKDIVKNHSFEAGVEFVQSTPEEVEARKQYMASKTGQTGD
jgi:hypothetical protein